MSDEKPKFKMPKTLGAAADRLYEVRQKRLDQQKVVDVLAAEEAALKDHIINNLPKSEASGVAGKLCRVSVVTKQVPQAKDWEAFWKSFNKKTDTDLLQRRLSDAAIKERWEAGKTVPGIVPFNVVSVSVNKL